MPDPGSFNVNAQARATATASYSTRNRGGNQKIGQYYEGIVTNSRSYQRAADIYDIIIPRLNNTRFYEVPRAARLARGSRGGDVNTTLRPGDRIYVIFEQSNLRSPIIMDIFPHRGGDPRSWKDGTNLNTFLQEGYEAPAFENLSMPPLSIDWVQANFEGKYNYTAAFAEGLPGNRHLVDGLGNTSDKYSGEVVRVYDGNVFESLLGKDQSIADAIQESQKVRDKQIAQWLQEHYGNPPEKEKLRPGWEEELLARQLEVLQASIEERQKSSEDQMLQYQFLESAILPCLSELSAKWNSIWACNQGSSALDIQLPIFGSLSQKLGISVPFWAAAPLQFIPGVLDLGCGIDLRGAFNIDFTAKLSVLICCGVDGKGFSISARPDVNLGASIGGSAIPTATTGRIKTAGKARSTPVSQEDLYEDGILYDKNETRNDTYLGVASPPSSRLTPFKTSTLSQSLDPLSQILDNLDVKRPQQLVRELDSLHGTGNPAYLLRTLALIAERPVKASLAASASYLGVPSLELINESVANRATSNIRCQNINAGITKSFYKIQEGDLNEHGKLYEKLNFPVPILREWLDDKNSVSDWLHTVNSQVATAADALIDGDYTAFLLEVIALQTHTDLTLYSREYYALVNQLKIRYNLRSVGADKTLSSVRTYYSNV